MSDGCVDQALVHDIRERFAEVEARVAAAAGRVGRSPEDVTVVAVTKRHPIEVIEAACAAGVRHVGENYAQELVDKFERSACADRLVWHFIGRVQHNKAKYLVGRSALIHALDSASAARELHKRMAKKMSEEERAAPDRGLPKQRVLVAVNLSGEVQKSGVGPGDLPGFLAELAVLEHLACVGLMTMPPLVEDPEENRGYFRELAALRDRVATREQPLPELSMGTTHDFEVAVEEGATLVRVGTAIFGERPI